MDRHLTTNDAAKLLQVSPLTIANWIDAGRFEGFRTAGGHRRVLVSALREYCWTAGLPVPPELDRLAGKLKILVVDDVPQILNAIRRAFKPLAAQVDLTLTKSGIEALLLLSDTKPDGMLIDINMPLLDGLEVCRRVRAYHPLSKVRLLAMTAFMRSTTAAEAVDAGALACLEKPLDVDKVVQLIRTGRIGPGNQPKPNNLRRHEARP